LPERTHPAQPTSDSPAKAARPRVARRRRIGLWLLAFAVAVGLYLLPQHPALRGWLLDRVQAAVAEAGYALRYRTSGGNAWTHLSLEGASLRGPGVEIEVEALRLGYFLPSLLTGSLPLSLEARRIEGTLVLAELELPATQDARGPSIRPVLRDVNVQDVSLVIAEAPYTLPDFSLSELSVRDAGEALALDGRVTTAEGEAVVQARLTLEPFRIRGTLDGDLAVAQHWWDGVLGGHASGSFDLGSAYLAADLEVAQGTVMLVDTVIDEIHGPVSYRHPTVSAELRGRALGGEVAATGGVDLSAERWQAEVTGWAGLREVAAWLAEGRTALPLEALPLTGRADLELRVGGWQHVELDGEAQGRGELWGEALETLQTSFAFASDRGLNVDAEARYGDGPVAFAMRPHEAGFDLTFAADGLPLGPLRAEADLALASRGGALSGNGALAARGSWLAREVELVGDLTLDSDGVQLFVSGSDGLGAEVSGAVLVQGERLEGQLAVRSLSLPGLEQPADLQLRADGELAALPLTLTLASDNPLYPTVGSVRLANDLRGTFVARLERAQLQDLEASLGGLALAGELDVLTGQGALAFSLQETRLAGALDGTVALSGGALRLEPAGLYAEGDLSLQELGNDLASLPVLAGRTTLAADETGLQLAFQDAARGVTLSWQEAALEAEFQSTPVRFGEQEAALEGMLALDTTSPEDTLALALTANADGLALSLAGDGEAATLQLASPAGSRWYGLALAEALSLEGTLSLQRAQLELSGAVGELALGVTAAGGAGGWEGRGSLTSRDEALELAFAAGSWQTQGTLPLDPLAEVFGLSVPGGLRSELGWSAALGYHGALRAQSELAGEVLYLTLEGFDERLELRAQTRQLGETFRLVTDVYPTVTGTFTAGSWGEVALAGEPGNLVASGGGTLPGVALAALELAPQPWQLEAAQAAARAELRVGASRLALDWQDGLRLEGNLDQQAHFRETHLHLGAALHYGDGAPEGDVQGRLTLTAGEAHAQLPLTGTLDELLLSGSVPAALLTETLGVEVVEARGNLELRAALQPLANAFEITGSWREVATPLAFAFGPDGGTLAGEGLSLRFDGTSWRVDAEGFALDGLVSAPLSLTLDGALETRALASWQGELTLTSPDPDAQLRLTGAGETLQGVLELSHPTGNVRAIGELFPALALELEGSALEHVHLHGNVAGPWQAPQLQAELSITAWQDDALGIHIPAQRAELQGALAPLEVQITGEGLELTLREGRWAGEVALVALLHGAQHHLRGAVSGPLDDPAFEGRIEGSYLQGPLQASRQGGHLSWHIDAGPWLPPALTTPRAEAHLAVDEQGHWQLGLEATAAYEALPLRLRGTVSGEGASYQGEGQLSLAGEAAVLRVGGDGGTLAAEAAFDAFSLASLAQTLPVALAGNLDGRLSLVRMEGWRLQAALDATGTLQAHPFTLALNASETSMTLTGTVADIDIDVRERAGRYQLTLGGERQALHASGEAQVADGVHVTLQGRYAGEPLELSLDYDARTQAATLRGEALGARLQGALEPQPDGRFRAQLSAPAGTLGQDALSADLQGRWQGEALTLESSTLQAALAGEVATLTLQGPLWPSLEVEGSLEAAPLETPATLALRRLETGFAASLAYNGLELNAETGSGFGLRQLTLTGEGEVSGALLTSRLVWRDSLGFVGAASLAARTGDIHTRWQLRGEGSLLASGELTLAGEPLATLTFELADLPLQGWDGQLQLEAHAPRALVSWPGESVRGHASLALTGDLGAPQLQGAVAFSGALAAAGELRADLAGGSLALQGDGLVLNAAFDRQGWEADAVLAASDLAAALPQLDSPRLDATLQAAQRWGGTPELQLEQLALQTAHSQITGSIDVTNWQGELELALDLRDLDLGETALQGTVRGPLRLMPDGGLAGEWQVRGVGLEGAPWWLDGQAEAAGTLEAPTLQLELMGGGEARGRLEASLQPAEQRYRLHSTLAVAALTSDVRLDLSADGVQAEGSVSWGKLSLWVSPNDTPGQLLLHGAGGLEGWQGTLDVAHETLTLQGELSALHPSAAGRLALALAADGPDWLSGELRGARVGPLELGDAQLFSSANGVRRRAYLEGDGLRGRVELNGGLGWRLERFERPVTEHATLRLTGAGDLHQGDLTGTLAGTFMDEAAHVLFEASYDAASLSLRAEGELLAGRLALEARHESASGWQGEVTLRGAAWLGGLLELDSSLSGATAQPTLQGRLLYEAESVRSEGAFTLSPQQARLEQTLRTDALVDVLTLDANLAPNGLLVVESSAGGRLVLRLEDGVLQTEGALELALAGAALTLRGHDGALDARLELPAGDLAFETHIPRETPANLLTRWQDEGLRFSGLGAASGTVVLEPNEQLRLRSDALSYRTDAGVLELQGEVRLQRGLRGRLYGRWQGDASAEPELLPWLRELQEASFDLLLEGERATLSADSALGPLEARFDLPARALELHTKLTPAGGEIRAQVHYDPAQGPQGTVHVRAFPLTRSPSGETLTLEGQLELDARGVSGEGRVQIGRGSLRASGEAGWRHLLPMLGPEWLPEAGEQLRASVRVDAFDLAELPFAERHLPYLHAPASGIAQLQQGSVTGQLLLPELRIHDTPLPGEVEFNGTLEGVEVRARLGTSRMTLHYDGSALTGLTQLENFPLHVVAEAFVGETGVTADATGVMRLEIPFGALEESVVRVASERIRLERDGVVTTGEVALSYQDGRFAIDRAEFTGAGSWRAQGEASAERLELSLEAVNANFDPLLGLVPHLAAWGVGAQGSFKLQAQGSLGAPEITLTSPQLDVQVGGSSYRLERAELTLEDELLESRARLHGLEPVTGTVNVEGRGRVTLWPLRSQGLSIGFAGHAHVPAVGEVSALRGTLRPGEGDWPLDVEGHLGNPFRISGTLSPLTLQLEGERLNLASPQHHLLGSDTDVRLTLDYQGDFILSGELFARNARLGLGQREVSIQTGEGAPNPLLERFRFNDVRIRAPQQIRFQENVGTAEIGLDVTLSGTAAAPELSGEARALRGSFTFAGRDFQLVRGVASFEQAQGLFPVLELHARTSFDKARVLAQSGARLEFVAPREGASFDVLLDITGGFEEEAGGVRRLRLTPALSSNALIQEVNGAVGASTGARPLSEAELVTLLTVGRLELDTAAGGLAGSVAQSALDTALDLVILNELQNVLAEALGVDLFEIRTTPLSSLLEGDGDSFGVSFRLGSYVSDDVFASFRISRVSDAEGFSLSNEFSLRYDLSPLHLNLTGGINLSEGMYAVPEFSASLGYAVTPLTSIEANLGLSSTRQSFGFGLGIRW
jgi:hypothetical protein